ncbi:MAG TPA: DNA adenine methylase [Polyangiaceae bacterium]|nr:DNA adenine methylase [Polyangiaceae bacterium]
MALGGAATPRGLGSAGAPTRALRPILKWAGGKTRLVPRILALLPAQIETYYEPFVGGAAVFFALAAEKRFKRAVLGDKNRELIDVYKGVKADVDGVITLLTDYARRHDEETYYQTRELDPSTLDLSERAARLIYLNKTGYNGLYRVNRQGRFNVPFGRYDNPKICNEPRLRAASEALRARGVSIKVADFEALSERAEPGDVVYFDPPYVPLTKTASFTGYHSESFGEEAHRRLAGAFASLTRRKVAAVLSNSGGEETKKLYAGKKVDVEMVMVGRPINSSAGKRGAVAELVVSNTRGLGIV